MAVAPGQPTVPSAFHGCVAAPSASRHTPSHPPCSLRAARGLAQRRRPPTRMRRHTCMRVHMHAHVHAHCAFWEDRFGVPSPCFSLACPPATRRVSLCPAERSEPAGLRERAERNPGGRVCHLAWPGKGPQLGVCPLRAAASVGAHGGSVLKHPKQAQTTEMHFSRSGGWKFKIKTSPGGSIWVLSPWHGKAVSSPVLRAVPLCMSVT